MALKSKTMELSKRKSRTILPPLAKWRAQCHRATPRLADVSVGAGVTQRRHDNMTCPSRWRRPNTLLRSFPVGYRDHSECASGQFPVPTITVSMADEYVPPVLPSIVVTTHETDWPPSFQRPPVGHVLSSATTAQAKNLLSVDDARRGFELDLIKMASLPRSHPPCCAPPRDMQRSLDRNADHQGFRRDNAAKRAQRKADVTSVRNDVIHVGRQTEDNSERATVSCKGSDYDRFGDRIRVKSRSRARSRKGRRTDNGYTETQGDRRGGRGLETDGGMENGSELYEAGECWDMEPGKAGGDEAAVKDKRKNENNANIAAYDSSASASITTVSDIADAGAICFEFGSGDYKDVFPDETSDDAPVSAPDAAERGVSTQTDCDTDDDDDDDDEEEDDEDDVDDEDAADEGQDWSVADDTPTGSKTPQACISQESPNTSERSPRAAARAGAVVAETVTPDVTSTDAHAQEDDDDEGCVLTTDAELADSEPPCEQQSQIFGVSDCSEADTVIEIVYPTSVSSDPNVAPSLPLDPVELADTNRSSHERSSGGSPGRALGKSRSECYTKGVPDAESKSSIPVPRDRFVPTKAKSACEDLTRSRSARVSRPRKSGSPVRRKASIPRPTGRVSSVASMSKHEGSNKLGKSWTDIPRSDSDGGDGGDAARRRRRSSKQKKTASTRSRKLTQSCDAGSPRMSSGSPMNLVRTRLKEAIVTKPAEVIFTICGNVNSDTSVTRHGRVPVIQCAAPARRQHSVETTKSRLKCEAYCHNDGMMQVNSVYSNHLPLDSYVPHCYLHLY